MKKSIVKKEGLWTIDELAEAVPGAASTSLIVISIY